MALTDVTQLRFSLQPCAPNIRLQQSIHEKKERIARARGANQPGHVSRNEGVPGHCRPRRGRLRRRRTRSPEVPAPLHRRRRCPSSSHLCSVLASEHPFCRRMTSPGVCLSIARSDAALGLVKAGEPERERHPGTGGHLLRQGRGHRVVQERQPPAPPRRLPRRRPGQDNQVPCLCLCSPEEKTSHKHLPPAVNIILTPRSLEWAMQVLHGMPGDEAAAEARHSRGEVQQRVPRVRARGLALRCRAHIQFSSSIDLVPLLFFRSAQFCLSLPMIHNNGHADYGVDRYDVGTGFGHFGIGVDDVNTTSTPLLSISPPSSVRRCHLCRGNSSLSVPTGCKDG
jgi:hypothetical protein